MIKSHNQPDNSNSQQQEEEENKEINAREDVRANLMAILGRLQNNQQVLAAEIENGDLESQNQRHGRRGFNRDRVRRALMRNRAGPSYDADPYGPQNEQQGTCGQF